MSNRTKLEEARFTFMLSEKKGPSELFETSPNLQPIAPSYRVGSADVVRGFASLLVCVFHLIHHLPRTSLLHAPTRHWGVVGVFMFFTVSGFVVPLSIYRLKPKYRIRDFSRYILRRIARLDPPYFLSILLAMATIYAANLTPWYQGQPPNYSAPQILAHIGYLNGILGYHWVNGVYWTLSLEFQFYIFIGLLLPLLVHSNPFVSKTTFWLVCLTAFLPQFRTFAEVHYSVLIHRFFPIFLMGIAAFSLHVRRIRLPEYLFTIGVLSVMFYHRLPIVTGALTSLFITTTVWNPGRFLRFLSNVSYSLYLTHVPVGRSLVHILRRLMPDSLAAEFVIILIAGLSCLGFAYAFYRLVEVPSLRLSNWLKPPSAVSSQSSTDMSLVT